MIERSEKECRNFDDDDDELYIESYKLQVRMYLKLASWKGTLYLRIYVFVTQHHDYPILCIIRLLYIMFSVIRRCFEELNSLT